MGAPSTGLSEQDITAIQQDYKGDYRAQCSAALAKWRHKFGLRATFLMLAQGLERTKDLEGVEKLCKTFKQVRPLTSSDFNRPSTDSAAAGEFLARMVKSPHYSHTHLIARRLSRVGACEHSLS